MRPSSQAVRHNRRSGGQPVLGAARDLALAEALDRRQLQLARAPLGTGRDRRHEGRLARRAAAPLAAGAHSAEIGIVHLHPPRKPCLPSRRAITAMILCFTVQAVGCLTPRRRPSSTDEMPFFAVTIRWMAANQSVSGSLVAWKIVPAVGDVCFLQRLH